MAEAAVESSQNRFFCHQCSVLIDPKLPDYTCPRCQSGFIEEMQDREPEEQPAPLQPPEMDPAERFAEIWGHTFLDSLTNMDDGRAAEAEGHDADGPMAPDAEADEPTMRSYPFRQNRIMFRAPGVRHVRYQAIENIVQQLLTGLTGGAVFGRTGTFPIGTMLNLYGNPGDYAWGAGGLDSIISQLLNQFDGTGPPPASKENIQKLPTTKITKEQVDKALQCSVCMEDFKLDESVRCLPCNHHYHTDCIVPWLELHGTCPVCRKNLEGQDTTSGPAAGDPGIPNTEFLESELRRAAHPSATSMSHNPNNPSTSSSSSSSSSSSTSAARQPSQESDQFDTIDEYD